MGDIHLQFDKKMIYISSILFTLFFVYYSKYQFKDLRNERNIKWKSFGVGMRVLFFVACFLSQFFNSSWQDYLLAGSINIFLFEWLINVIALNAPSIFWKGYSSKIDNEIGQAKWIIMVALILASITIKILIK